MSVGCFFSLLQKPLKRGIHPNIEGCFLILLFLFTSNASAQFRLVETGGTFTEYIALQAPASIATNFTWTMPGADGTPNQCLATNGSGTLFWYTPAGGSAFSLNASDGSPTNALYVNANGDVGIGTTAPATKLEVVGSTRAWTFEAGQGSLSAPSYGSSNYGMIFPAGTSTALVTNGAERLRIDSTGRVGVGLTNPAYDFDLQRNYNGTTTARIYNNSSTMSASAQLLFGNDTSPTAANIVLNSAFNTTLGGTNSLNISNGSAAPITLRTGSVERLRIDGSGNVGVGTTSASATLDVNGFVRISGNGTPTSGAGIEMIYNAGIGYVFPYDRSAAAGRDLILGNSGAGIIVKNGGNVGIGTTNPQAGLDVAVTGTSASAMIVPRDTTANRPTTAVNGMIRYNSTTAKFEGYENGGWVPLSSGLVGSLRYAGTANCDWTNPSSGSWVSFAADTDCANATVTGGATAPGTKIPGIVTNNLPAGDYEVTVVTQFRMTAGAGNSCRYRISDGTNTSGLLVTSSDQVDQSSTVGLFSYASAGSRTFQIQAIATSNNICHVYADEPGTVEFVIWVKRI